MPAVWKLAWPTMLTNIIGGLQGIVDHVMVGHLVGFNANAGIGVASQIWIVIIVFIMSVFTGMSVLVARFVGAGNEEMRSEEHTSELQSQSNLVCRLLLEKKKKDETAGH